MKRKLLTLLLAGCMVLSLAACGKEEAKETEEAAESTEDTVEIDRSALGTSTLTELGEYKGMTYVPYDATVTDEDVELQVQYMLSVSEIPQEVVTEKSYVVIDYVGKKDGVAFDGGTADDQTLSIENSGYIPGFAESIVGMKVGETKDCPMTFPEDYHAEDLKGADVVFTITVDKCYLRAEEVNDEFAQSEGYETVDALYEGVREDYEAYEQDNAQADMEYQIIEEVIANSTFDINEAEVAVYVDDLEKEYEQYAYAYGYDLETYVTLSNMTMEAFDAQNREIALYRIKSPLVLAAIAEAEGLTVPEEEYAERAQKYVEYYNKNSVEELEEAYTKETIMLQLTADLALEHLVENAVATAEEN